MRISFTSPRRWLVLGGHLLGIAVVALLVLMPVGYQTYSTRDNEPRELPNDLSDFLRGDYYFNHGPYADGTYDLVKAREHYERALSVQPLGDSLAWYQIGRIDFLEGKFDAAIYKFEQQLALFGDEQLPGVYYMLGLTYGYRARYENNTADWDRAAEYFNQYLARDPESPWAATDLAWVYFAQGKYEAMLPILETGLSHNPDNPWVHNMYGLALLNTGKREEARTHFIQAREQAAALSVEDWARSYPGNDPRVWDEGLAEFRSTIERNLTLTE